MSDAAAVPQPQSTVIPAVRYADADAAMAWLEAALDFKRRAVYRDSADRVAHAELTFDTPAGTGMVMLGSVHLDPSNDSAPFYRQPAGVNGVTAVFYLVVADCEALWARAQAAHADVLTPLKSMDYGGAAFSLRDPEGFVWSVGEYNPWAQPAQ
jgi:uncharacterized glyoxalase superfamily protein PhnB